METAYSDSSRPLWGISKLASDSTREQKKLYWDGAAFVPHPITAKLFASLAEAQDAAARIERQRGTKVFVDTWYINNV